MDNREIDKILKEKLKGKINISPEMEAKIKEKVAEEKRVRANSKNSNQQNDKIKTNKYKKIKSITSIAAMILVIFTIGILLNNKYLNLEEGTDSVVTISAIEPTKLKNGILENDSEFIIHVEGNDVTKENVQKSLYIEPALDYTIEETSNSNEYKLKFKQNIPDNTIVKLQYIKDKITENSWAYQTSNKLSINRTYPSNNASSVSSNSIIEIEFSYASVENLQKYVNITPETKGNWEHLGKIWRFIPETELKEETNYTITIRRGITAEGESLENDYIFNFIVNREESMTLAYNYDTKTIDGINTYQLDERINIYYTRNTEKTEISKIEISQFKNTEDFIEYVKTKNYEKAESLGEYEFEQNEHYLQLNKTLPNGYYVASIQTSKGKEIFNCPIQINDLSAYALETERDVIVWVANNDDLAKNIKVNYQGKEQKTNNQGIAKFEGIADNSETIKYLTIGNDENKLVVGLYNYTFENYPSAYLYTDRPLYKNTDTINIWGFVPRELFYDKIEDEFYIELNEEGKQKVKVNEDGSLNYKIELKNHIDYEYSYITLYYKNESIAVRSFKIENYELQNYIYETILDKNYTYSGSKFDFDIKVKHITGLVVPNKSVVIKYGENIYKEITSTDGIAHFSINVNEEDNLKSEPTYQEINIYNGDAEEYTDAEKYFGIYVLNRNTYTKIENSEENLYKVTLYKLDDEKKTNVGYDLKEIYDGAYDTTVEINLVENVTERYISGYIYNEYTKEEEPEYSYKNGGDNTKKVKTITTQNGSFEIDINELEFNKDTEEKSYSYYLQFLYQDGNGKKVKEEQYIYLGEDYYNTSLGYYYDGFSEIQSSDDSLYEASSEIDYNYYYTYRYMLKGMKDKFSIGETVNFNLAESTIGGIKDIQNNGKILKVVLKEDIIDTQIIEDNYISHTFSDEDFPGCKITTAYFYNGKFYRMPIYYLDFEEEDRKVDVEISADREEYKPGDEVNLTIKTTNKGTPIKTFVNISVVNKAIFMNQEDDTTSLLETIYYDKNYPIYTYSSYGDYINSLSGGGGGGDGEPRGDFADTAYFETIYTDSKGIAKVKFTLPDNVTTYRVTVHSANKDLYLGENTIDIVSKLDFFVQSTEPRGVKTTDDLVLNATSIAEKNYEVDYEFTIKEINKTLTTTGMTNNVVTANFGKLPYGTYHAIIKGKNENQEDSIEYEFNIVESTQEVQSKTTININNNTKISPTKNPIILELYNKNMSKYLQYIEFVESTLTQRLDTQIAYNQVQKIKDQYYGTQSTINYLDMENYKGEKYLKNLENGVDDIVLTALTSFYARDYANDYYAKNMEECILENDNIFEIYLLAAANNEPVLTDLLYLKEEKNIENYNKLLVTLSLEFVGDFQNAKELYHSIELTEAEKEEYKSIIAIIDTFINKQEAIIKIDNLIQVNPADEYLRFAILSFFRNVSTEIGKESIIKITSTNLNKTITINGMQVQTYTINNEDLSDIKFETSSNDIMVSYYYQTLLDNIESRDIVKDTRINIDGNLEKGNTVNLVIEFDGSYEGNVRIALPNALRLAQVYNGDLYNKEWCLQSNQIDYLTLYKKESCTRIELPLLVTLDGNYKFENIVLCNDGIYHISNSLNLNISK